jgi:hypothetical protein
MNDSFDAGWLALREVHDARARSEALANALIATLPARPKLLDLGAGSGSLFRWLAPRIWRAQAWTLFDADAELIEVAFDVIGMWAEDLGLRVTTPGRAMLVHAPGGAWRIEAVIGDLADIARLPLFGHHAVVNSALCDLVSKPWIEQLAGRLAVPFYAALMVDGRAQYLPPNPLDRVVHHAFRRDQRRDKGFGPALGHRAPAVLHAAFARRRFRVQTAISDWRIGREETAMLTAMLEGDTDAALRADPVRATRIEQWVLRRTSQARRRQLSLRLGHRDLLAVPR